MTEVLEQLARFSQDFQMDRLEDVLHRIHQQGEDDPDMIHTRDHQGRDALEWCVRITSLSPGSLYLSWMETIITSLLQKGAVIDAPRHRGLLCRAIQLGWFKLIFRILRQCPEMVDDVGDHGRSPLHAVLQSRFISLLKNMILKELLDRGADPLVEDEYGNLPLHYARIPQIFKTGSYLYRSTHGMWFHVLSRKVQEAGRNFSIVPSQELSTTITPITTKTMVFQEAACRLPPCLLRELSEMLC